MIQLINKKKMIKRKYKINIKKHGTLRCIQAFYMNVYLGNGARTIGDDLDVTTRQAEAMIETAEAIEEHDSESFYKTIKKLKDERFR